MVSTDSRINRGVCYGCGVCAAFCPKNAITIERRNGDILYAAVDETKCNDCGICKRICPANGWETIHFPESISKSEMERCLYPYTDIGIGFSSNQQLRWGGTSGGLVTTILDYLLESREIEGAIVVRQEGTLRGESYIATKKEDLIRSQKSKYFMISYEDALRKIGDYNSLALVGLPCHLEAVRRASLVFPEIGKIIKYRFSLLCAANNRTDLYCYLMKSRNVAWRDVERIDFRPGVWWDFDYFSVYPKDGAREDYSFRKGLVPGLNHTRLLARGACLLCPDFSGHSADISLGDAWFPTFEGNEDGYNFCIVRNEKARRLIETLKKGKRIGFRTIGIDDFFYSSLLWPLSYKHIGVRGRAGLFRLFQKKTPINIPSTSGLLNKLNAANMYANRYLFSTVLRKLSPHKFKRLILLYCKMVLLIHRLTLIMDKRVFYKYIARARLLGRHPEIRME